MIPISGSFVQGGGEGAERVRVAGARNFLDVIVTGAIDPEEALWLVGQRVQLFNLPEREYAIAF